jgi:hypothetical protein
MCGNGRASGSGSESGNASANRCCRAHAGGVEQAVTSATHTRMPLCSAGACPLVFLVLERGRSYSHLSDLIGRVVVGEGSRWANGRVGQFDVLRR